MGFSFHDGDLDNRLAAPPCSAGLDMGEVYSARYSGDVPPDLIIHPPGTGAGEFRHQVAGKIMRTDGNSHGPAPEPAK